MDRFDEIHQSSKSDLSRVAAFLERSPLVHRHLDWRGTLDWLESQPFLLMTKSDEILALLAAPPDPPNFAWIRCFAAGQNTSPESVWKPLVGAARPVLESMNAQLVAVGLEDWFTRLLIKNGFSSSQKIVVLEWDHHLSAPIQLPENVTLRPMEPSDIDAVSEVDRLSFEPLWVNSGPSLYLAFLQSEHTSVAEVNGKIIAYELSTASQYSAHLARLAVLPNYRQHSIGRALVTEMLSYYSRRGLLQVTVNTQSDNQASLHLYKSLGFHLTLEEYPVLTK